MARRIGELPPALAAKGRMLARNSRKRRNDPATGAAASQPIEPETSDDVAPILAARAQIPAEVRERLLASGQTLQGTASERRLEKSEAGRFPVCRGKVACEAAFAACFLRQASATSQLGARCPHWCRVKAKCREAGDRRFVPQESNHLVQLPLLAQCVSQIHASHSTAWFIRLESQCLAVFGHGLVQLPLLTQDIGQVAMSGGVVGPEPDRLAQVRSELCLNGLGLVQLA